MVVEAFSIGNDLLPEKDELTWEREGSTPGEGATEFCCVPFTEDACVFRGEGSGSVIGTYRERRPGRGEKISVHRLEMIELPADTRHFAGDKQLSRRSVTVRSSTPSSSSPFLG